MIPSEFLTAYLVANGVALGMLVVAFRSRDAARWIGACVFAWAAVINSWTALVRPEVYVDYATLTPSAIYRDFILGWFSHHVRLLVWPIAIGQAAIAVLLASRPLAARWLGVLGAVAFLLAIAPLGVGSGFPFSLTFGAALLVSAGAGEVRTPVFRGLLRWTPRVIGLVTTIALGLLALDTFDGAGPSPGVMEQAGQLVLHLVPAGLALGVLLLAWRRAWAGGAACFVLAIVYAALVDGRVDWMIVVSVPLLVEGGLFLWSSTASHAKVPHRASLAGPRGL